MPNLNEGWEAKRPPELARKLPGRPRTRDECSTVCKDFVERLPPGKAWPKANGTMPLDAD